jgi:hypothetical protein
MKACDALEGLHPSAGAYFSEPLARETLAATVRAG